MRARTVWTPILNRKWVRIAACKPVIPLKYARFAYPPHVEIRQEKGTSVLEMWFHLEYDDTVTLRRYQHGDFKSLLSHWRSFLISSEKTEPEQLSLMQRLWDKRLAEDELWQDSNNQSIGKLVLFQGIPKTRSDVISVVPEPHRGIFEIPEFQIWLDDLEKMHHQFRTAIVYPD